MSANVMRQALAEFPELRRLMDLRAAGWQFTPQVHGGDVVDVRGVRVWPDDWADAITVRFITDAAALRLDPTGGIVWQKDGGLVDVVDSLIALPSPTSHNAPRLVRGHGPLLWTPSSAAGRPWRLESTST